MTRTRHLFAGLAVALASWLTAGSAYAQNFHSWVASTGSGSACTRAMPCASFATAEAATAAGGVISVLDPGDYGNVFITQSLTIRAEGVDAGMTSIPFSSPWITVSVSATDLVTLEGLHLNSGSIHLPAGAYPHRV